MSQIRVLSAGAAQGVVSALAHAEGYALVADFGAVGAMQKKLLDGEPCDLIVLTGQLIADLTTRGRVIASADLGMVQTGIAVREADDLPGIETSSALSAALFDADEIYFPDPQKATAGIHFQKVLQELRVSGRPLKTYPNGATAMREMAGSKAKRVIGCTQVTEIKNTPGAKLVGPLPAQFRLATVYTAGLCAGAQNDALARRFLARLCGTESAQLRRTAGFEL